MSRLRSLCSLFPGLLSIIPCCGWLVAATPAVGQALEPSSGRDTTFQRCRTIKDDTARVRCFEDASSKSAANPTPPQSTGAGAWRLVRSHNPAGGPDAVSIMHTADVSRSDIDLAGLMLRCGDTTIEVLVVVVRPFPPRAHPEVTIDAGTTTGKFTASVVPPDALLLLPPNATQLAEGPWQAAPEIVVTVEHDQGPIRGVVQLSGLASAIQVLQSNCATR
jgi:hypothetical protein